MSLSYTIKRSARRRTVCLEVRDAQLLVRAPLGVPALELDRFVHQKSTWIARKVHAQRQLLAKIPEYRYVSGTRLPFMGGWLTLLVTEGVSGQVELRGDQLLIRCSRRSRQEPEEQARRLVQGWYREQGLALLSAKTDTLTQRMGMTHAGVKVRVTRSKWGHCTRSGEIQYNWQILLAPEAVVDYLVAHEVCHLRHPNHSRAFWQLVGQVCPDYPRQRDWLKTNGRCLVL